MHAGILRLGREQLATRSATELSVREIARGLGVSSSAVYRHVSSRDDLLTLLVVDAFTDLADRVDDAVDPTDTPSDQLRDLTTAVRAWAVANPERWALIYGTPVPGYAAPRDRTVSPGTRVMAVFIGILARGRTPEDAEPPSADLAGRLADGASDLGLTAPPTLLAEAVSAWASVVGTVSTEIFGQLGPDLAEVGGELLARVTTDIARRYRLTE